jgi:hypothetical protein
MDVSDLLTLIGILLAILAVISEKNRDFIFLKFSNFEVYVLLFLIVFIHYLISYDWWRTQFVFLQKFEREVFPTTPAWAYLFSLSTLTWVSIKTFKSKFPISNKKKVLAYYNNLLLKEEALFLSILVEKYHLGDVLNFLKAKKSIVIKNETGIVFFDSPEYRSAYKASMDTDSKIYGELIYNQIINDESFVDNVVNRNPYLFAEIISELDCDKVKNDDLVNRFLKILTKERNGQFFREIRLSQRLGDISNDESPNNRQILFSLFKNIKVASVNQAWRGIAEQAILEIEEETKKEFSLLRENNLASMKDEDIIWSFRLEVALVYFDIMIRESIIQGGSDHMWMFYCRRFLEGVLKNMSAIAPQKAETNLHSMNFDFINNIFLNMLYWINLSLEKKNDKLIQSIVDCIGQCIYLITITKKLKLEEKTDLLKTVWMHFITLCPAEDSDDSRGRIENIIDLSFEIFNLKAYYPNQKDKLEHINSIMNMWETRDRPVFTGVFKNRSERFEKAIIIPLQG